MHSPRHLGGLWSRLVPAECVEEAYADGWNDRNNHHEADYMSQEEDWDKSDAKKDMEGLR